MKTVPRENRAAFTGFYVRKGIVPPGMDHYIGLVNAALMCLL